MKKLLSLFVFALTVQSGYSQTVIYTQTFESAPAFALNSTDQGGTGSGENPWVINNIYSGGTGSFMCLGFPFPYTVPACANQPAGITNNPNSQYLHITPQIAIASGGSLPAASYVAADGLCILGGQSTFAKMSGDISTVGYDSVTLDLWWMCGGSTAYYGELFYSTNGGMAWTQVNNPENGTSSWKDETTWIASELWNANWDNQATLRFGFRFVSGSTTTGSEADPGFAIDDIVVTGYNTCTNTTNTINVSACDEYVSPSGNFTWSSDGTYNDVIPNMAGCDSLLTINLTINTVDATANQSGLTLSANNAGATSYQWLDCDNAYAIISGATNQNYTVSSNGDYAVSVTDNGCTDTSACISISDVGLEIYHGVSILIYPNPTENFVTVSVNSNEILQIELMDASGRVIQNTWLNNGLNQLDLSAFSAGSYFINIRNSEGEIVKSERIKKN